MHEILGTMSEILGWVDDVDTLVKDLTHFFFGQLVLPHC